MISPVATKQPSFNLSDRNQAWFQFAWVSNEMNSPKVLLCPADKEKFIADGWGDQSGGFVNPSIRNRAVSYALALDSGRVSETTIVPLNSSAILLTDRNVQTTGTNNTCSSGVGLAAEIDPRLTPARWRTDLKINEGGGNIALLDGSVEAVNDRELAERLKPTISNGEMHFLIP